MDAFSKNAEGCTELEASSLAVGLPEGLMGNSEVGHLNIGAGRVVWQDVVRIDQTIKKGELNQNEVIVKTFRLAKEGTGRLHLAGLILDGGVVSEIIPYLSKKLIQHIVFQARLSLRSPSRLYPFLQRFGRDTNPKSGAGYMEDLLNKIKEIGIGEVATAVGRYYAMDRDKRWERIEVAPKSICLGEREQ